MADEYGYGTKYMETEALLAVMSDDLSAARAIIATALPNERKHLQRACDTLSGLCEPKVEDWSGGQVLGE